MTFDDEPQTSADIVRELLEALEERVWVETNDGGCSRGCCQPKHFIACSECRAREGDWRDQETYRQHKPECKLNALIVKSEAFLQAEEELARMRDGQALPHHPS